METLTPILMLASRFVLASALLMALYWFVWRKQATYRAKRTFLLSLPAVALAISLIQVEVYKPDPVVIETTGSTTFSTASAPIADNPTISPILTTVHTPKEAEKEEATGILHAPTFDQTIGQKDFPASWLLTAYTFIIIGLCLPFAVNLMQLHRLHKCGKVEETDEEGCRIITAEEVKAPFSCHRTIYLPQQLTASQRRMILCHELSHIRHRHYRDVWVIETLTRLLWWNPFLWWCRKELRNVHEFEADSDVLATGENVSAYQAILIEEVMHGDVVITNGFNHSFIRRRFIEMLESSNRRMTSRGKVVTTAWMILTAGLMCCTVGEAETVYRVMSDEPQIDTRPTKKESVQDSAINTTVAISIENEKMAASNEGVQDSMTADIFRESGKKVTTVPLQTTERTDGQPQQAASPTRSEAQVPPQYPLSEYKELAETDSIAKMNYNLLMECIRKVQGYCKQIASDRNLTQTDIDDHVNAYTVQTFGKAGIRLMPGGGYRLPDQTIVIEDGKSYGSPASYGEHGGKTTPTRIVQNAKLAFAPITFDEYGSMVHTFRLIRYPDETHLVLYICPTSMQEMINLSWQSILSNPDTGDRYMLRGIQGFTNDISAVIVNNCQSVPLQLTYIFPPLEQDIKRVQVHIPGHIEQTHRINEIAMNPGRVVRDNSLRARCVQPSTDEWKPENQAPDMKRDKSPNYDVQNEHTFPIYTEVQTGQPQVFHRENDHYKVYRGKECTYVVKTCRVRWDWEFFINSSNMMLIDPETDTRYMIAGTEHFPLDTYYWVYGQKGQYIRFISVFPPLPEQVNSVDIFEGNCLRRNNSGLAKRLRNLQVQNYHQASPAKQKGKVIY